MVNNLYDKTLNYLRESLDRPDAEFRESQWEAIRTVVEDRSRALIVQRTGWGKSMVYFLATRLLRDEGRGPTLLISPLLSLMRNQIDAAERIGINAVTINSTNEEEWQDVEAKLSEGSVDILLISPERLANDNFREKMLLPVVDDIGLFVVDEAHCISDWGHDFRPDYLRISRIVSLLPRNCPVIATTATANERVVDDVATQFGGDLKIFRGPLVRHSLSLQNITFPSKAERMAWLADKLPGIRGSGIIYVLTKRDADRLAEWLQINGIDARAYYADEKIDRISLEQKLLNNEVKALVATVALGMGFDKPDLGFVIHFQRPGSAVFYYQQVGRAGRAVDDAYGILLSGAEDADITDYFIRTAFPPEIHVNRILDALENAPDGLSIPMLQQQLNLRWTDIDKVFKILTVQTPSPVTKIERRWFRTAVEFKVDNQKAEKIMSQRRHEQKRMLDYIETGSCLMEFLSRELDDPHAQECGKCANCLGEPVIPLEYPTSLAIKAVEFLKRSDIPIESRIMWPSGGIMNGTVRGRIHADSRHHRGRSLCMWGDAGWGEMVRVGKHDGHFNDELVKGAADMIINRWMPDPFPMWLTCVPSLGRPELVPEFARRLAHELGLPFHECIVKTRNTEPQKSMQNSFMQAQNVYGAFEIDEEPSDFDEPVLLIDDIVDSRWTMTIVGALLRDQGSGKVYPLALANAADTPSYVEKSTKWRSTI